MRKQNIYRARRPLRNAIYASMGQRLRFERPCRISRVAYSGLKKQTELSKSCLHVLIQIMGVHLQVHVSPLLWFCETRQVSASLRTPGNEQANHQFLMQQLGCWMCSWTATHG